MVHYPQSDRWWRILLPTSVLLRKVKPSFMLWVCPLWSAMTHGWREMCLGLSLTGVGFTYILQLPPSFLCIAPHTSSFGRLGSTCWFCGWPKVRRFCLAPLTLCRLGRFCSTFVHSSWWAKEQDRLCGSGIWAAGCLKNDGEVCFYLFSFAVTVSDC